MSTMKVKIIADTLIKGVPVPASDEIIEVDTADAVILISAYKAEKYNAPPADITPEIVADVLQQAKEELLEKISQAESIQELDQLISEDPEVIAAYEARLLEIEEPHH